MHQVVQSYLAGTGHGAGVRHDIRGIEQLAEHLSLTEINSSEAERESVKIKLLEFFERELAKKKRTAFAADHHRRAPARLFHRAGRVDDVRVRRLRDDLGDDYYQLNNAGNALVGRRKHRTLRTERPA